MKELINRPYETDSCWEFCRDMFRTYGVTLPVLPYEGLKRIEPDEVTVPSIVLFRCGPDWHVGVVWPDGLHFVHASLEESGYVVRKERLTRWPWTVLFEGFYANA